MKTKGLLQNFILSKIIKKKVETLSDGNKKRCLFLIRYHSSKRTKCSFKRNALKCRKIELVSARGISICLKTNQMPILSIEKFIIICSLKIYPFQPITRNKMRPKLGVFFFHH